MIVLIIIIIVIWRFDLLKRMFNYGSGYWSEMKSVRVRVHVGPIHREL